MNTTTRNPALRRPVERFVDMPAIVGKAADALKETIEEIKSLSARAQYYSPIAAQRDFHAERARMMDAGELTDAHIAKLGTAESWAKNYEASGAMLTEAGARRRTAAFKQFRPLYQKIEAALVTRQKAAVATEQALADAAGVSYAPSSGVQSISDTIEVLRRRLQAADENPANAPDLTEYFAAALK